MATSMHVRLLDSRTFTASQTQETAEAVDLGAYRELNVMVRVLVAGGANETVTLQHAPVNAEDAYMDLVVASISTTTPTFEQVTGFTRFVRWKTDLPSSGTPTVTLDIVAKE